jgi:hypothetical protein
MVISYLKVSNVALGLLAAGFEAALVDSAAHSNVALVESAAAVAQETLWSRNSKWN